MIEDANCSTTLVRVMVVDDSALTRVSLKTSLKKNIQSVLFVGEAENGQEALQKLETLIPHVILMDIGMPVLDGIAATQQIKKRYPSVKVIMITSHEEQSMVRDAFQSGAHSYCLKETSPEMLIHVILSTAHGACWIDPKIAWIVMQQLSVEENVDPGETSLVKTLLVPLTEREKEVLRLVTKGLNNADISESLCISLNTVKTHLKNIFQKLDVEDRTSAALKALQERLV